MKTTIHTIVLAFIKLLFLSAFLAFGSTEKNSRYVSKQEDMNLDSAINLFKTPFYDQTNHPLQFSDTCNYFIVLENRKKCDNCFLDINSFIAAEKNNFHANFVAIILTDSNSLERKRDYVHNKILMPEMQYFLFQYLNSGVKTIFESYQTSFTPELILVNKGKIKHIPYRSIFDFPNSGFTEATKKEIFDFLK